MLINRVICEKNGLSLHGGSLLDVGNTAHELKEQLMESDLSDNSSVS
jgi:hypothetical protein